MSGFVGVRFPDNHPIMDYPKGQRSFRVRELVDMGLEIKDTLISISVNLKMINERLAHIESESKSSGVVKFNLADNQPSDNHHIKVDLDAFSDL